MRWLLSIVVLANTATLAEDLRINYDTTFKTSTVQSDSLPVNEKCNVAAGTIAVGKSLSLTDNHYRVTLANQLPNCDFTSGYFYAPHIDRESQLLTVHSNTIFKLRPLSSNQLPASEKCNLAPKVYASTSAIAAASDGHYFVNLAGGSNDCGFSSGYIYEGHSQRGAMAIQTTFTTVFKRSPEDSGSLPAADKCDMPVNTYVLTSPAQSARGGHYKVTLTNGLNSCNFLTGYVYFDHTHLPEPGSDSDTFFTFPMPSGTLGSAWCVCRNIGTSPHIGQDIFRSGGMSAVAVQSGVVESTTFSSSCGYISLVRDDFDTLWRYVHLNSPTVAQGNRINKGQTLASVSQYPLSGCGSGAHLHFERRSAGFFADAATGRSCQNGYRSCYYDPIKPWRTSASVLSTTALTTQALNWNNAATKPRTACKVAPEDYPQVDNTLLADYQRAGTKQFSSTLARYKRANAPDVLHGSLTLAENPNNHCESKTCLTTWQVLAEQGDGTLRRIFFENRLRNRVPLRDEREQYCLAENTQKIWILTKDKQGNRFKHTL